jgi:uncharacterized repeat protein (TIGR03843 family)
MGINLKVAGLKITRDKFQQNFIRIYMPPSQENNVLTVLEKGQLTIRGEFVWGSNYTFLAQVEHQGYKTDAVYKPIRGERPLWDFPAASLAWREVAAYRVSEALGWELVPPTVFRQDGPAGEGSLQLFIEHNPEYHYFNFTDADKARLRPFALFYVLINNADRKGSHLLFDPDDHLWLIDHGLSFHVEDKLRTIIWDFAGERISPNILSNVETFLQALSSNSSLISGLHECLSTNEISALYRRAEHLITTGQYPSPDPNRRVFPLPAI